ncbi:pyridoxamine 5'-phosphate oxidase family protein [Microbacterium amylolyticum]|uniref:Pyridoxamine 5'-phosphate oxidase n=1 Tax=Microbacterium amylolyticum TaxID=936337 RepID=A0ABS4ZJ17_9MICO|nr:pyridoxamine 5'-phosphate oxidase family protein [Microbacterium amylolyticum]MBP2437290.1 pyridoxamine 5'-phosphate oxidase [Microbacterium amylolyticum]
MSRETSGAPGNVPPKTLERPVQDGRVPHDPFPLLADWLPENEDPNRPVCTLATVDENGLPDARTLLLSGHYDDRVTFHTEASSRKAIQIRVNPVGAIVVRWEELARQVVLRGRVVPSSEAEAAAAFARRNRYLRLLASLNTDEMAARPRVEREAAFADVDRSQPNPPQPEGWAGYALIPSDVLFWEGSGAGPSRRARYRRDGSGWSLSFLAG